jgi:hypothetical protein
MVRPMIIVVVLGVVAAGIVGGQSTPPAATPDPKLVAAFGDFRQAVYEFGLSLILSEDKAVRVEIRQMWQQLTRLRERVCPQPLNRHVREVAQVSSINKALGPKLELVKADLDKLGQTMDVSEARKHYEGAQAAYAANKPADLRKECQAVMDAVIGQMVGVPMVSNIDILRRASAILSTSTNAARRQEAFAVLRELPNFERGKARAYRDALAQADLGIASAGDLFGEGYYLQAQQQLGSIAPPLKLAVMTAPDPQAVRKINGIGSDLVEAERLLTSGWSNNAEVGLFMLRKSREQLGGLNDASIDQFERPKTTAPSPSTSTGS